MTRLISIVIPNHNGGRFLKNCLSAALTVDYPHYEVIVVDDCSSDNSIEIIDQFPCTLIKLDRHAGASGARNIGARKSKGEILFFIDADCILQPDALRLAAKYHSQYGPDTVIGGTYTAQPFDDVFFSRFQSAFIHYSETKNLENPDYIASHAMVIAKETFLLSGGFPEQFMPILEDVEFSHRLKRNGGRLIMRPDILVRHYFDYTLPASLKNAYRKTRYWSQYSLANKDLMTDSGTASIELKINVLIFTAIVLLGSAMLLSQPPWLTYPLVLLFIFNMIINRGLYFLMCTSFGIFFATLAYGYYALIYPIPIIIGAAGGIFAHSFSGKRR